MHYYEWNDLIGSLLFKPSRAGQPVLLYVTREQVIQAAMRTNVFETENDAWVSFSRSGRRWFGPTKNLTDCIIDSLTRSPQVTLSNGTIHKTDYPICLTLLVQSVMPLIDGGEESISQADYYNRAAEYAHQQGLPPITTNDANQNWNAAWQYVQHWSTTLKHGQLGRFTINHTFGHRYVGKPFSQCLIPPQAIRDLPRAFVRAGWVPHQPLTRQHWQALLTNHCYDLGFRQAALKTMRTDDGLNYAQSILQERFDRWDGTSQTAASGGGVTKLGSGTNRRTQISKEDTLARFHLTFPDLNDTDYRFDWHYRIRAGQALPDTLHINEQTFAGQLGGWSSAVAGSFEEGKQGYDALNKWKVKWPDASIRLFESGQWHGLSSRVWVEANELSRVNKMWAVCRPDQKDVMRRWGNTFRTGQFKEYIPNEDFDATNWPVGYGLFAFERPTQGLPQAGYALSETKQLRFIGGLQLRFGTYDDRHRPTLQVVNGDGTEVVTAFTEAGQQITLESYGKNPTLYSFTGDILPQPIICRIVGTEGTAICQFVQAGDIERSQTYSALPGRDSFGGPVTDEKSVAAFTGFDVSGVAEGRLHFIKTSRHVFHPGSTDPQLAYAPREGEWSLGDDLLTFLTNRREGRAAHFFDAYETLLTKAISEQDTELPQNVSRYRRWALGWYDTLGYVDYDYESGRVRVLRPALLPVPCQHGHRAILVGGRSPKLLAQLQRSAELLGVQVFVESQPDTTYLAPSVVSLYSPQSFYSKTYSPIQQVAEQVGISYLADELPAWRLLERSGSLTDYRATLQPEPEAASATWTLRVFNPTRLRFERATDNEVDHSFALVERQLNAYEVVHYLWMDGQSYRVDKNWGRFLVLHQRGQQVVFRREQHNQIAIPATLPLPRVLARGFALLSGKIPVREEHNFDGIRRAYLLYDNAGSILSGNYIQKLGQQLQSTNC